jgi:hypothetical protein
VDAAQLILTIVSVVIAAATLAVILHDRKPHVKIECGLYRAGTTPEK